MQCVNTLLSKGPPTTTVMYKHLAVTGAPTSIVMF